VSSQVIDIDPQRCINIDTELTIDDIDLEQINIIEEFRPF